jgi:cytochrome d ubiquinol oxidase subunit II
MLTHLTNRPWLFVFPAIAIGALVATWVFQRRAQWRHAFLASSLFIAGMLATAAAALYPNILPARQGHPYGLTIHNAATGHHALVVATIWWSIGMVLAITYFTVAYRTFLRPKVDVAYGDGD